MKAPSPRICCLDLDTFFVSVERLLHPELVGQPVVVGPREGTRGVVTAASYEVREFGVHAGMSAVEARRLAPHAIFVPSTSGVYSSYAAKVKAILMDFTPEVQTASIDEFYLGFHGCERLYHRSIDVDADATIERTVRRMRQRIQDDLGLPSSVGIACSKPLAKMGSKRAKPAGVFMVRSGEEWDFVRDMPVGAWPGIGPRAQERLASAGLRTLGQLIYPPPGPGRARFSRLSGRVSSGVFGERATHLGRDRPAFREHDPDGLTVGSISNERTFHSDLGDRQQVLDRLRGLCERVCWRARKRGIRARTVTLKIRFSDFHTISRGRTVSPTHAEADVLALTRDLLDLAWTRGRPLRLLGVCLSNLVGQERQLRLPLGVDSTPDVGGAIDAVRLKFGYDAIRMGSTRPGVSARS
ncbi:MAG: DNA polymerase-4 [Kiritimatiellia bacterium]|jgi:DNA polymerase-4